MIYTLTLNPSLDYIMNVMDFTTGAVNRTCAEKYLPGGKGINVSIVLSNLGVPTKVLGFLAGFIGEEIERSLCAMGVATDFVHLPGGISRINVKIKADEETEINAKGPAIDVQSMDALYSKLGNISDGDYIVLAGSVPKGMSENIYCDIMKYLEQKNVHIVVDAEKQLLVNTLEYKPFLIKPNHHELGDIFGTKLTQPEEIAEYARKLQHMGAVNVLVSMGGDGGVLISENGDTYFCPAPSGNVINSTGAGDSSVAGFVSAYSHSGDYKTAFAYALCAGSASAFSENLATADEIQSLFKKQNMISKVQPIG